MITIDFLKHHPDAILPFAKLWKDLIGDVWAPDVSEASVVERFTTHMNTDALPLT